MSLLPDQISFERELRPRLVSVKDAARLLGIGVTKVYELISDGLLDTISIGARRLVTLSSIDALIQRSSGGA